MGDGVFLLWELYSNMTLGNIGILSLAYMAVWYSFIQSITSRRGYGSSSVYYAIFPVALGCLLYGYLEMVSIGFRCLSLPSRLTGNLLAGHIVLHMLSLLTIGTIESLSRILCLSVYMLLAILEIALSCIQVIIWTQLSAIYYPRSETRPNMDLESSIPYYRA